MEDAALFRMEGFDTLDPHPLHRKRIGSRCEIEEFLRAAGLKGLERVSALIPKILEASPPLLIFLGCALRIEMRLEGSIRRVRNAAGRLRAIHLLSPASRNFRNGTPTFSTTFLRS
ncbi:hypothetical protein JTE90_014555 [Oedothorax gibbosus]|uniref:Uncharacterized protein n=1 Tax=Oedothorax gibbosus TaxID=931172 RepID=A0AAV6UCP7_9ARAC|nr:hypothetical protein JTE90_014555 [Oedothorax gibbosus]